MWRSTAARFNHGELAQHGAALDQQRGAEHDRGDGQKVQRSHAGKADNRQHDGGDAAERIDKAAITDGLGRRAGRGI